MNLGVGEFELYTQWAIPATTIFKVIILCLCIYAYFMTSYYNKKELKNRFRQAPQNFACLHVPLLLTNSDVLSFSSEGSSKSGVLDQLTS